MIPLDIKESVDKIFSYYEKYGAHDYIGEPVTQVEHMTQGAMFAEMDRRKPEIVIALFLHDIGHLLEFDDSSGEKMGNLGVMHHETKGKIFLQQLGIPYPIPNLVENHVKVKRYLVKKKSEYLQNLSEASRQTLNYQGGPMTLEEIYEFERDPLFSDSLLIRDYDDMGKIPNMKIKPLDYYRGYLTSYLTQRFS